MVILSSIISFITFVYGLFILLDIPILSLAREVENFVNKERRDLKYVLEDKDNSSKGIKNIIKETYMILDLMNKKERLDYVWIASLFLFIIGTVIAVSFGNLFLVPVLSIGLALIPFWFIIFSYISFRKQINEELETSLSTITTAYIRTENIVVAVEENINYINEPIRSVFSFFLSQTRLITSNTKLALENIRDKINNDIYQEWIDVMISCQDNKSLKHTLSPVVAKLSDTRIVSAELDTLLYKPLKEFITLMIMVLANIPLIRILNKDWYNVLTNTKLGQITLTVTILSVFISINAVVKLSRPIEYKS